MDQFTTMPWILNNINDGIILKDEKGVIIFVNQKIEEFLGYLPEDLVGLTTEEATKVLVEVDALFKIQLNREKVKGGQSVVTRRSFKHKTGQVVPLEVKGHPVYDQQGNLDGELLVLRDLHEDLLVKVTTLVNSSLALNDVLHNTACAVVDYLGLVSSAIFLPNEAKTELQLTSCNVFTSEALPNVTFKVGVGPPGRIYAEKRPIYVRDLGTDPDIPPFARQFHQEKSSIGYPLICNNELLGVIAFDAGTIREFSDREQVLFQNIADQVALAIYKAQLFSQLKYLSTTDGLTGLYNHRYFQGRLAEVLAEVKDKKEKFFSILMLDVDNFKNYNDSRGHQVGDVLLKELAQLIQQNVRNFDIVARYGGEEFSVILLGCDRNEAAIIAERIRCSVEQYHFSGGKNQPHGKVTISIGVATFPEVKYHHKLLGYADKALYRAKRKGRNRVEVHTAS